MIKRIGKRFLARRLEKQVSRLRQKHSFKLIAVTGSVGKTSTKLAIAKTLGSSARVQYQDGNYNDRLTVPLVFFGQTEPGIFNILGWLKLLAANRKAFKKDYPYDYVIVELGTDAPGQVGEFAYLKPELSVITAVTPEHMEYFGDLAAVAKEELAVCAFSKQMLINTDDTPAEFLVDKQYLSYGLARGDYHAGSIQTTKLEGVMFDMTTPKGTLNMLTFSMLGSQGVKTALAAAATAELFGFDEAAIKQGLATIKPFAGRMQILPGAQNSTIIDDTYNASPAAVTAALDVLYATEAPQRVAILGSMNELGNTSPEAHKAVGEYCDPRRLDLVVTIGTDANTYLAPAAETKGCTVKAFDNAQTAGTFVLEQLKPGAVILAKGSQNGVFAEEAVKLLLADPGDSTKLVRQSASWKAIKQRQGLTA